MPWLQQNERGIHAAGFEETAANAGRAHSCASPCCGAVLSFSSIASQAISSLLFFCVQAQAGVVKDLATHTTGTVAAPGTILMTLVPVDEPLVAEVWVSNDDVGFVREGQPVKLKFSTFQFQKYGMLEGRVRQVSADASENQNSAVTSVEIGRNRSAMPLTYKTIVQMNTQDLTAQNVRYALAPGMQVAAEIHLGTRTVLEYLFSPVSKAFHEAGRER